VIKPSFFSRDSLEKILVEKGLVNKSDLNKALELKKNTGGSLGETLVGMGLISKTDLTVIVCQAFGCPAIDLTRYRISSEMIKLVPKKIAKNYKLIPVSRMGNVLTVAMSDPSNIIAIDDLKAITKCDIGIVVASEKDIVNAIAECYEGFTHESIEQIVDGIQDDADISLMANVSESDVGKDDLIRLTQDAPIVKITNILLSEGVGMGASDILIEPLENELRVRYRVDGMLVEGRKPPKKIHSAIISRLKVMSDLNIAERRLPQDGRFKIRISSREVDFRISILPSHIGEKAALRILDKSQATLDLETLGFDTKSLENVRIASGRPHGMILVCGPTGCGKTTTLYSILKSIDSPEKNIVTVEDPVEYQLGGINQVSVKVDIGLTFAGSLRSILRQDPDIIMVGEIRDYDTVDIAIKAALTGHLVLSTLHTTSACGSIVRLVNMGVEPFLITSTVLIIAAQRLVRKICPRCKESHKLDSKAATALKLPHGAKVYMGKGCKYCRGTGYKGRVGVIETLVLTPKVKALILEKAQEQIISEAASKEGMESLRNNAVQKLLEGVTSVEEILRVTIGEQDIRVEEK